MKAIDILLAIFLAFVLVSSKTQSEEADSEVTTCSTAEWLECGGTLVECISLCYETRVGCLDCGRRAWEYCSTCLKPTIESFSETLQGRGFTEQKPFADACTVEQWESCGQTFGRCMFMCTDESGSIAECTECFVSLWEDCNQCLSPEIAEPLKS